MQREHSWVLTIAAVMVAVTGCVPNQQGRLQKAKIGWVAAATKKLVASGKAPLTADQVKELLMPPEVALQMLDLPEFLRKEAGYDSETAEEQMDRTYERYLRSHLLTHGNGKQRVAEHGEWKKDVRFSKNCRVWIYAWKDPEEIVLGGMIPEKTGVVVSVYFLVEDERIIDSGPLMRSAGTP
jgi:hypothetical protein